MKLDLREDKYAKTKGIKDVKKASDEVLQDTIDTGSPAAKPAEKELKSRKKKAAASGENSEKTPEEKPAEKEAEKPAEKPEETPDEEPKDEPKEPESDSTDSEDDVKSLIRSEEEKQRKQAVSKSKQALNDITSIVKLKRLEKEDEENLNNKVIDFLKIKASNVFSFDPTDETLRGKIADDIKNEMQKDIDETDAKATDLETLLRKYEKPEHFQIAKKILKQKGIEDPAEFLSKSKEEREKIITEIQNAIDEDEGKEKPKQKTKKKKTNERYRGIHGALKAIQENTGLRKDYASMRTILNRMYGEN